MRRGVAIFVMSSVSRLLVWDNGQCMVKRRWLKFVVVVVEVGDVVERLLEGKRGVFCRDESVGPRAIH